MERHLRAIFRDGVLHPVEPLLLGEMQEVSVTIHDAQVADEDVTGYFTPEEWQAAAHDAVTWEDSRRALAGISGSLSSAVIAQRHER